MIKFTAAGLSAVAIVGMMAATQAMAQDLTPIRVGYIADHNGTSTVALATELGLWEKHGLDAQLNVFTNGPIQIQALGAGSLDFGYIGAGALWLPASGQAKIVAVNSITYTDRVIAKPGIESIEDLQGRRVAVPEGTSGDMILRLSLERAGMTMDDVEPVYMDPGTVVTAFASGQVDAAGIWYPFVEVIRNQAGELNELTNNETFMPEIAFVSSFVVRNDMADEEETIRRFNAVVKEANDYRLANLEESIRITADFVGAPADAFAAQAAHTSYPTSEELEAYTADGTIDAWFDKLAEIYVDLGRIEDPLPASEFYLSRFYLD